MDIEQLRLPVRYACTRQVLLLAPNCHSGFSFTLTTHPTITSASRIIRSISHRHPSHPLNSISHQDEPTARLHRVLRSLRAPTEIECAKVNLDLVLLADTHNSGEQDSLAGVATIGSGRRVPMGSHRREPTTRVLPPTTQRHALFGPGTHLRFRHQLLLWFRLWDGNRDGVR